MRIYPRTAEEIIRSGDLEKCGIRELLDLAREMDVPGRTDHRPTMLRLLKAEARTRGWLS